MAKDDDWDDDDRDLAVMRDSWEDQEEEEVAEAWDEVEVEESEEKNKQGGDKIGAAKSSSRTPTTTTKAKPKGKEKTSNSILEDYKDEYINETDAEKKARLEKLVKERDLESAMSLFGIENAASGATGSKMQSNSYQQSRRSGFEDANPTTIPEFDTFTRLITRKLETMESNRHYPQFVEGLVVALMGRREVPEMRKVAGILTDMATGKLQREKQQQGAKGKGSAPSSIAPLLKNTKPSKGAGRFDDCYAGGDYDDPFDE